MVYYVVPLSGVLHSCSIYCLKFNCTALQIAVNAEQDMTVMAGTQMVALNCPITGATEPITYKWFHSPAKGQNETQVSMC